MTVTSGRSSATDEGDPRLRSLAALATDLAGQFALAPLLERILQHTLTLLQCASGSICTVDELAGTYRKEVDIGVGCLSGRTFPLDEGVTGEVVRARRPVLFDEYADVRGGHIGAEDRSRLHGVVGVPIRWDGSIIGTCVVFSEEPARRFTDEDVMLVELFATHAAIAMANARMYARAAEKESDAAILAERERVARDLHDTVGRGLATVLLQLDAAEREIRRAHEPIDALAAARAAARAALTEAQRAVLGFGPSLLDGRSLHEAVALELAWVQSTSTIDTRFVVSGEPEALAPETARQLFRIVQEALTNVVKHSRARSVRVGLVYGRSEVAAMVEDDGIGFDVPKLSSVRTRTARGLGLQGLAARAPLLGGTLSLESTPGWGTRISAAVPYATSAEPAIARSRWRVLIVHERAVVRAGLVRMLGQVEPDIQVVGEVSNAIEAVEAFRLVAPHVVLGNLALPRIDGPQLTSYLRAIDPNAAVVLLIDSFADERVRAASQIGAVGFVPNDVEPDPLARALVAAARGDALIPAETLRSFTSPDRATTDSLTPREREVRAFVERGLPDKRIATELRISVKTVEKHVGSILRKTGARNRTMLAGLATNSGR
ncbi:GAF domain-containing protein [Mycetocola zhadangensis]|nr:GAF domain-containing protein [Mycetocola zhadangensis]